MTKKIALFALVAGMLAAAPLSAEAKADGKALLTKNNCLACHAMTQAEPKKLGPSFQDIAARYKGNKAASTKLITKVQKGGAGAWGSVPMPPQAQIPAADVKAMVEYILKGH